MSSFLNIDYNNQRPSEKQLVEPENIGVGKERKTYYSVKASQIELDAIEKFKIEYKKQIEEGIIDKRYDIPEDWAEGNYLRYVCTNELNVENMVKQVAKHFEWLESLKSFNLSAKSVYYIKNGNVYIGARDKKGVPTMVLSIHDLSGYDEEDAKALVKAIEFTLLTIR